MFKIKKILCATVAFSLLLAAFAPLKSFAEGKVKTENTDEVLATYYEDTIAPVSSFYGNSKEERAVPGVKDKLYYTLPGIVSRRIDSLPNLKATVNGKNLSKPAVMMNGIVYLPLRAAAAALGNATVSYDKSTGIATLRLPGLELQASDGGFVVYANNRVLFGFSPSVMMSDGSMYICASIFAKATGTAFTKGAGSVSLDGRLRPIAPAAEYYRSDEVLWLSRIIQAESGGESLIGQIAVGNVIMNRVDSPSYPNTIWGVIFDRRYGVQFSPILNGSIYNTPSFTSTLAAKIILEGVRLDKEVLFFLNPIYSQSGWIVNNRPYAYSIGGHDFYR